MYAPPIEDKGEPKVTELPLVFGRYLLLKRLSRGGMGEIFLAKLGEIQGFEKPVIIKKVLPNLTTDQEFVKRFIDEAQVAIKLNHANIAPVFEVGRVDGDYFLALEYVEGRDLRRLVARQRDLHTRLPHDLCLYIVRELAAGLAYAHRRTDDKGQGLSVVHCDISPPNVMVSFEGEVKVIDFGFAKSSIRIAGSNPNMGFGKFGYMAPEQLVRGGVVDKRTDIYAAGVVLYELLTGERLFTFPEGGDYRAIARMVTAGKFAPPSARDPQIGPELDDLVMRALATKPQARYQTAEEFRDAIQIRLSQMNPALSADTLAHYIRDLFREEITEERRLVATMKAVDVAPFREELTHATAEHTVTYARAPGLVARLRRGSGQVLALNSAEGATHNEGVLDLGRGRGLWLFAAVALVAAVVVGSVAMFFRLRAHPAKPPVVVTTTTAVGGGPAPSEIIQPTVVTLPVSATTASGDGEARHHHRTSGSSGTVHSARTATTTAPHNAAAANSGSVESKYHAVKQEYAAFSQKYGPVLDDKWTAVANEITFGQGDRLQRTDQLLDQLRRDMARVRAGHGE